MTMKCVPLLVFVSLLLAAGLVLFVPTASATPSYDYLVQSNLVKNGAGATVYTAASMPAALTWALGHAYTTTYIPPGTYTFSSSATIGSAATLISEGTVIASATSNCHLLSASGKSHFTVNGGKWDANQASNPYGGGDRDAFRFTSCSNVTLENLEVCNSPYGNIEVDNSIYVTLTNVTSHDSGIVGAAEAWRGLSIILANTSNSIVQNCHIYNSARGGVYFYTEDDAVIEHIDNNIMRNNTVQNTQTSGLSLSIRGAGDTAINGLIENNICIDCGRDGEHPGINCGWADGSTVRLASYCTVRDNLVYESGSYGALQCGGGINCQGNNCLVLNNSIHDVQDFLLLVMGNYNNASWNTLDLMTTSFYEGIYLNDANGCNITYNRISNCTNGIQLYYGSSNNLIAYNHLETITTYEVGIRSSDCNYNAVRNNSYYGTWTTTDSGAGNSITSNFYGGFIWPLPAPIPPVVPPVIPPVVPPVPPPVDPPIAPVIGGDAEIPVVPFVIGAISANHTSGTYPLAVLFSVTVTGGSGIYAFNWNMDNGIHITSEDPAYTFTAVGIYHVSLKVNGISAPNILTITITSPTIPLPPSPNGTGNGSIDMSSIAVIMPVAVVIGIVGLMVSMVRRD